MILDGPPEFLRQHLPTLPERRRRRAVRAVHALQLTHPEREDGFSLAEISDWLKGEGDWDELFGQFKSCPQLLGQALLDAFNAELLARDFRRHGHWYRPGPPTKEELAE